MADTFHQIYIQTVFAVKNRRSLILPTWEEDLYKYTTGILHNRGHKMLAIGGMPDHVHIFMGFNPSETLSSLVREIKKSTHAFIENQKFAPEFEWQAGYGGFSYNRNQLEVVCQYIANQKIHHQKKTFKEEYLALLAEFEIEIGRKVPFDFDLPE
ncbi:MAG: IS200/IS605 family transposase [Bacteroidia bacterium]|nr:IS200/IS605 family transposase [Bacteroidia bacterium]